MSKRSKGDVAYQRDNFILEFIDSNCSYDLNQHKTIEEIRRAIEECDEGLADWYSIISPDDPPDIMATNRRGIQRVKREKIYLKRKLAELLKMENKCKGSSTPR